MNRTWFAPAAAAIVALAGTIALAGPKDKVEIKPSVRYAKSWDAAVTEAKELNVPITVHSHGFY